MYSKKSRKLEVISPKKQKKAHVIFSLSHIFIIIMTWSCHSVSLSMNSSRGLFVQCSIGFEGFIALILDSSLL